MNEPAPAVSPALRRYFQLLNQYPALVSNEKSPLRVILDLKRIRRFELQSGQKIGVLAEDEYVIFIHDLVENEGGKPFVYLRLLVAPHLAGGYGSVVLPIARFAGRKYVILIRIFRHALRAWSLELPRGFGGNGLTVAESAKKELLEETGLQASTMQLVGTVAPDGGLLQNSALVFLAEVELARGIECKPETGEAIKQTVLMGLVELRDAIVHGEIQDGYTLAALTLARAEGAVVF